MQEILGSREPPGKVESELRPDDMLPADDPTPPLGMTGKPRCSVIVVSYNSALHLPPCLVALEAQQGVEPEIHVVDNASTDGSADLVRSGFPGVRLRRNSRNLGFAGANNQVLEGERAEFVALVNPDTVLSPRALAACVDCLRQDPGVGVAATRLVNPDGSLQPSCHSFLNLANLFGETFGMHRLLPGVRTLSSLDMPWFAHDRRAEVDWLQGSFLVVRGEVVRTVGGFDPDYYMYGEEMDWCRRIRRAGWRIVFLPGPSVVHVGGASSRPIAGPMFVENQKARLRFFHKHRGPAAVFLAGVLIAASVLLRHAAREIQAAALRGAGRAPGEPLQLRLVMFRAARSWVLDGMPLSPTGTSVEGQRR